ncbi:hypothetical protein CCACVL1_07845 [Corchorus capsularis]|uniref:Uncharacterized protein n=1 Tax=Corchorus capsularis TaxID=210143 RepID=A0A1R3J3K9_COCAP|nr:hypothetical protein CCACVL1_07845 [Corchorus capsularis]
MLQQFMVDVSDAATIAFPPPDEDENTPDAESYVSKFLKDAEFRVKFLTSSEFRIFINCLVVAGKIGIGLYKFLKEKKAEENKPEEKKLPPVLHLPRRTSGLTALGGTGPRPGSDPGKIITSVQRPYHPSAYTMVDELKVSETQDHGLSRSSLLSKSPSTIWRRPWESEHKGSSHQLTRTMTIPTEIEPNDSPLQTESSRRGKGPADPPGELGSPDPYIGTPKARQAKGVSNDQTPNLGGQGQTPTFEPPTPHRRLERITEPATDTLSPRMRVVNPVQPGNGDVHIPPRVLGQ